MEVTMPTREPERAEYERRLVEWLRRLFLESDHHVPYRHGGRIEFADVRLERAGTEGSPVVIMFQAPDRPGCLYGRREDAIGPPEPLQDPMPRPSIGPQMVWISLEEDILTGPGLPKKCVPGTVTWM
jgi:hypothetical protein